VRLAQGHDPRPEVGAPGPEGHVGQLGGDGAPEVAVLGDQRDAPDGGRHGDARVLVADAGPVPKPRERPARRRIVGVRGRDHQHADALELPAPRPVRRRPDLDHGLGGGQQLEPAGRREAIHVGEERRVGGDRVEDHGVDHATKGRHRRRTIVRVAGLRA
jgi:hypothetical protein